MHKHERLWDSTEAGIAPTDKQYRCGDVWQAIDFCVGSKQSHLLGQRTDVAAV